MRLPSDTDSSPAPDPAAPSSAPTDSPCFETLAATTGSGANFIGEAHARHAPALLRYTMHLLGDHARACDVLQETFLALGRHTPVLPVPSPSSSASTIPADHDAPAASAPAETASAVAAWLFTVARRKALNLLRHERRSVSLDPAAAAALPDEHAAAPAARLETTEDHALLRDLVARLPAAQREAVRLRYQEGFRYAEIARIMDLSPSRVGVLLHQAIQSMRVAWEARAGR